MDDDLIPFMEKTTPKLNMKTSLGLAFSESKKFVPYVDGVFRLFAQTIKERSGITYHGMVPATPEERLQLETRPQDNKRAFEITRSDFQVMRVMFKHNGISMGRRYVYIPFFGRGGYSKIRDVVHYAMPTLADGMFSVEDGSIFVPVTRARFTIHQMRYMFIADDKQVNIDTYWSRLHHSRTNEAPRSRLPQINNYLFAELGLTKAFEYYYDCTIKHGSSDIVNGDTYPPSDWVICQSSGMRPPGKIAVSQETIESLRIAVRKDDFSRLEVQSALAAFFYIVDMAAGLEFFSCEDFEDPFLWKRTLGRFIWKEMDERDAMRHVEEHLSSISEYIDDNVIMKLQRVGVNAKTINELFHYFTVNFPRITIENNVAATLNKRLSVTEELMFPLQTMIFNLMFNLQRMSDKQLKVIKNVETMFNMNWRGQKLMHIGNNTKAVQVLESTTDQILYKGGTLIHVPSKSSSKNKTSEMNDPAFVLHPDMLFTTSWLAITKSSPTARNRWNPFTELDDLNRPIVNEKFRAWHEQLKELL